MYWQIVGKQWKNRRRKRASFWSTFWLPGRRPGAAKGILERYVFRFFRERIFVTFSSSLHEDPLWSWGGPQGAKSMFDWSKTITFAEGSGTPKSHIWRSWKGSWGRLWHPFSAPARRGNSQGQRPRRPKLAFREHFLEELKIANKSASGGPKWYFYTMILRFSCDHGCFFPCFYVDFWPKTWILGRPFGYPFGTFFVACSWVSAQGGKTLILMPT